MNSAEARKILQTFRPGRSETEDPETAEALALLRHDPALREWFQRQTAFHQTLERSFRAAPVPADLRSRLLLRSRVVPLRAPDRPPQQHRTWYAATAAILILLGAGWWWHQQSEDAFATFRSRMVRSVLRQYSMDLVTNDMTAIRQFLTGHQAPADYVLPPGLTSLPASGAGVLSWQGQRVAMVCLDSPDQGTLFLFVVDQSAVRPPPPRNPEYLQVSKLMTASWTRDGKTYVLAGSGGREGLQKRL